MSAGRIISTILRHDTKTTSYKIALIRAINDIVLGFPAMGTVRDLDQVAVPLRLLAEFWIAYYWPFVGSASILQGRPQGSKQDISFRGSLQALRSGFEGLAGESSDSDGYFLVSEMRSLRRARTYPTDIQKLYNSAIKQITVALRQPIHYAGPGEWSVFPKPQTWEVLKFKGNVEAVPGTQDGDVCIVISVPLWSEFLSVSLWVEALCVHEWSLFTELISGQSRGKVYEALTQRPDNRRPLTWERNRIEILMLEGHVFFCPWTRKRLTTENYDLDHLIPLAVYPMNELWNLVPAERIFNQRVKRDRLPKIERLDDFQSNLIQSYDLYTLSPELDSTLKQDASSRFGGTFGSTPLPPFLAGAVRGLIESIKNSRNVAEF